MTPDRFRRAATDLARILRDVKLADLPIEQPSTFKLAIHLKTAQMLGLKIPPQMQPGADRVSD